MAEQRRRYTRTTQHMRTLVRTFTHMHASPWRNAQPPGACDNNPKHWFKHTHSHAHASPPHTGSKDAIPISEDSVTLIADEDIHFASISLATKALNEHSTLGPTLDTRTVRNWGSGRRPYPVTGITVTFDESGNVDLPGEKWKFLALSKRQGQKVGVSNMGRYQNSDGQPPYFPSETSRDSPYARVTVDGEGVRMSRLVAAMWVTIPDHLAQNPLIEPDHLNGES